MVSFSTRTALRVPDDFACAGDLDVKDASLPSPHPRDELPSDASPCIVLGRRGGGQEGSTRTEQRTGISFPEEFCHLSKTHCPLLAGLGVRQKRLLGVKSVDVYAVGFYIDQTAALKAFGASYSKQPASEGDQKLFDDVIAASDVEKTVRIVVSSGLVNHDKFINGLKDSLVPACKKEGDSESLPQFERLFEGTNFRKGLEIAFTSTKTGGLAARIDNRDVGEVTSPAFTRAFFSLYLGAKPVSPDAKADIGKGLATLLLTASEPAAEK